MKGWLIWLAIVGPIVFAELSAYRLFEPKCPKGSYAQNYLFNYHCVVEVPRLP